MAELIIIKGKQNSGKSTAIGELYKKLLEFADKKHTFDFKEVISESLRYNSKKKILDFTAILTFGNLRVGIISEGDFAKYTKLILEVMIYLKLDVIICASRSINRKGSVYKMIKDYISLENKIILEFEIDYLKGNNKTEEIINQITRNIIDLSKKNNF